MLEQNMLRFKMAKRKDYVCNQCDYTTTRKFNMERHARVHENEMYSNRSIQEANQIEHVHHHEPLPSVQHGTGVHCKFKIN